MKVLQFNQRCFLTLGMSFSQPIPKNPSGAKILLTIFLLSVGIVATGAYFFDVASQFEEYAYSVYATSASLCCFGCFTIGLLRKSIISEYIEHLEKAVNRSKVPKFFQFIFSKHESRKI